MFLRQILRLFVGKAARDQTLAFPSTTYSWWHPRAMTGLCSPRCRGGGLVGGGDNYDYIYPRLRRMLKRQKAHTSPPAG